jgi:putative transcriptional regulator
MGTKQEVRNQVRRHRRAVEGLTQEALAERVGVTRQTIISIERGSYDPSVGLALRLAKALGVSVETLFEIGPEEEHG